MQDYKYFKLSWRELSPGMQVSMWQTEGGSEHHVSAMVRRIGPSDVTLLYWGVQEDTVPSENTLFYVQMTEAEFKERYSLTASEVARSIQRKLPEDDIGMHSYNDSWCIMQPYELAAQCEKGAFRVIGHCVFSHPERPDQDIGICCENSAGKRFWSGASSKELREMLAKYYEDKGIS